MRARRGVDGARLATLESPFEARIAAAELRLASLTQHIAAVDAERAAIAESLAYARASAREPRTADQMTPAPNNRRTLDVGRFRVSFGSPYGAEVEVGSARPTNRTGSSADRTPSQLSNCPVRREAQDAVWNALASGARIVRIAAEPGAGATALLASLAADAPAHGFADSVLSLTDVRGPAADVAQRLAALRYGAEPARYYLEGELRRAFRDLTTLVVLDRAELTATEQVQLRGLFPSLCFVVVGALALPAATTVELGPLDGDEILSLLQTSYGRTIDIADRKAALDACATVRALPGAIRLVGVAARELRCSFASLGGEYSSANAIVRALIAALSPVEQRILSVLSLAPARLSESRIAAIVGDGDIRASLERLCRCELFESNDSGYTLQRYVTPLVPALRDADIVFERIVDALCAMLAETPARSLADCQFVAAESLVQSTFERSQWPHVLALGPRLAEAFALRGAFGAWGRVLNLVAAAAKRVDDGTALRLAKHELGVRSLLLGEFQKSATYLRSAALARERAGDREGAVASNDVLALLDELPELTAAPHRATTTQQAITRRSPRSRAATRIRLPRRWLLLGLTAVAVALVFWAAATRPKSAPTLAEFFASSNSIAVGSTTRLCITAKDAALVTITPDIGPLPTRTEQCIAVRPAVTTRYTAVVVGADNHEERKDVTVSVHETRPLRPLRIGQFFFQPARITAGGSARLCYAVSGAEVLRTVPHLGNFKLPRGCRSITLTEPRRTTYKLVAIGEHGQVAIRRTQIVVVAASPPASPNPVIASTLQRSPTLPAPAQREAPDQRLARRAVYQFDVTPAVVERGQAASLCVGIGRWATGSVTDIGPLPPGITRCYRVHPYATTAYRLQVKLDASVAAETLRVLVRTPAHPHQIAHDERR